MRYTLRFSATPQYASKDVTSAVKNWETQMTFPLFQKPGPRMVNDSEGGFPGYYEEGFLAIQHSIAMSAVHHINNTPIPWHLTDRREDRIDDPIEVVLQRFPYPPYIEDIYLLALQFLFPMILMFSFLYPTVNLTKNLVIEKEKRLKESMKMMGLKNWLHWLAWFIKSILWLLISSALLTIILTIKLNEGVGILNESNRLLVYLFFISYSISCVSFAFLLSTFFSKVTENHLFL